MNVPLRINLLLACASLALSFFDGCHSGPSTGNPVTAASVAAPVPLRQAEAVGFDRNDYPGDNRLAELHRSFAYTGFWLTPPPGEQENSWQGKRQAVRDVGFGFLLLADGRLDAQIKRAPGAATALGKTDGLAAAEMAKKEGFPEGAIIFLDQEEGGRLLPEQAAYFFGWTEAVASSPYRPGAYLSGQRDPDGVGPDGRPVFITTAQDVREHIAQQHLHPVALWVYDDSCPPAPGCTATPPALAQSGTPDAVVWQYAQSPRRPALTASCQKTYAADNNCYAGATADLSVDLNVASSSDPSHGR